MQPNASRSRHRAHTAGRLLMLLAPLMLSSCSTTATDPRASQPGAPSAEDLVFPPPPDPARFVFERTIMSSADVVPEDRESRWRRILTGEVDSSTGFSKPFDVEACQGRLYVSDTVRRSVLMFDVPNGSFTEIGLEEPGSLRKPLGMAADSDCNLYVVDGTAKRVVVYDQDGNFLSAFGGMAMFERPSHVDVDQEGQYAFVVDTGGVDSQLHRVRVFDIASGEHRFDIGERGDGPGQLNLPRDIAVGPDGRIYVVDGANFRVQVFDHDGTFMNSFGSIGVYPGQFSRPKGVDTDPDGNVYVTDTAFGNFQIFDPDGQLLLFVGARSESLQPARYMLPAGIAVDEDGRVYMVDQFFRKVDVFRPAAIGPADGFMGVRAANR